ncbi:hypothetical protein ACEWY4_009679 [Coilia grayii]|uniref:Uncharacterized protein n=1 Tax=Coilia grayii TaxID=363190 RepID=A0ABD1K770_9TELE
MKVNIPQDSSRGMKSAYTPEHIEYGLLRSEAGGFTQNAPGSLYPGHPLKNEETITTVYTVPYFSINGERPGHFASDLVAQQPVQHTDVYVSPYGVTEMIPHTGYYKHGSSKTVQEPDARIGGKWAPQKLVFSNSVPVQSASSWSSGGQRPNRKSGLNHMAPNQHGGGKYERSYLPPFLREQVTNKQTFSQPPNIRPTPHINAPRLFSGENGATTGKGLDNVPLQTSQTLQSVAARPPLAKNRGASRENGRGGNGIHQSPGRRFDATADGKQSKRFRVKTRYLVRAFNQYQQGRLYQSHGSNDLKETDFPSAGETLNIRIQSTDNPGSNGQKR